MTKMKSKKMNKSTIAVILMAIAMVAMMAFGGTYAYFTAQGNLGSDEVTTATIALKSNDVALFDGKAVHGTNLMGASGNKVEVVVDTTSNADMWIVIEFNVALEPRSGVTLEDTANKTAAVNAGTLASTALGADEYALEYEVTNEWTQVQDGQTVLYVIEWDADAQTKVEKIAVCSAITFYGKTESTTNGTTVTYGDLMGATVNVTLTSKAIQKDGNADAAAAAKSLGYTNAAIVNAQP